MFPENICRHHDLFKKNIEANGILCDSGESFQTVDEKLSPN